MQSASPLHEPFIPCPALGFELDRLSVDLQSYARGERALAQDLERIIADPATAALTREAASILLAELDS